jgi:hypothetical protein
MQQKLSAPGAARFVPMVVDAAAFSGAVVAINASMPPFVPAASEYSSRQLTSLLLCDSDD